MSARSFTANFGDRCKHTFKFWPLNFLETRRWRWDQRRRRRRRWCRRRTSTGGATERFVCVCVRVRVCCMRMCVFGSFMTAFLWMSFFLCADKQQLYNLRMATRSLAHRCKGYRTDSRWRKTEFSFVLWIQIFCQIRWKSGSDWTKHTWWVREKPFFFFSISTFACFFPYSSLSHRYPLDIF